MERWLFLPGSVTKDLELLSTLSEIQFQALHKVLSADIGVRRYTISLRIAEALGIADEQAAGVYSLWRYVQDERTTNKKSGNEVVDEFLAFLEPLTQSGASKPEKHSKILEGIRERRKFLSSVFGDYPDRDKAKKIDGLALGPIPHFVEFKAICDVRPIYNETADSIDKHVIMLTLRFVTHGNYDEYNDVSMNIMEDDLESVEEELARLRKKINLLKTQYPDLVSRSSAHKTRGRSHG